MGKRAGEVAEGCDVVLSHPASRGLARAVCNALRVEPEVRAVWRAIEGNDRRAAAFARLLLWTHPHPLPFTEATAWGQYKAVWRPGKPHPERWPACWGVAEEVYPVARVGVG